MGNKQHQAKLRNSNISMNSLGRSVSTAPTNESGLIRFTTDGSLSSSMFGGVEFYFNRMPNTVIDGICQFLTINDLTNLYCTSRFVYERFYTSLPYSIACGNLLYKQYEDRRHIAQQAVQTKHASWPQVLQVFMENKKQMQILHINLRQSLQGAYQLHIIYPPLLMDEITKEGLNSDFQRQIMQKLQDCQECHTITEIQIMNQTRAYFKKSSLQKQQLLNTMLEIRTIRKFQVDQKLPQLFNILIILCSSIKSLLQIIALTLECAFNANDTVGLLDFYLYNYQMYLIWMQQVDEFATPYLKMFDIILNEQIKSYQSPPFTLQWIMMKMWNQCIYQKSKHFLRSIFLQLLQQVRLNPSLKYELFLLKDYISQLIDLSTDQSNIRMAGHSKFTYIKDLETLFQVVISQSVDLWNSRDFDFKTDINVLGYVFQKYILENNLLYSLLEQKYEIIKASIETIKQSQEYQKRTMKYDNDNQILQEQADYSFQLLNINKVYSKIKQIINGDFAMEQNVRLTINYQKNTLDRVQMYLREYHPDLYDSDFLISKY
ncbi:unnamed protein product (macronuclear) [Paramecium tetraurelia]|uniref:F-box domain-containing protein n=1 Tax=Paramecium tetraurelia TaxID=5888 RepID=A0BYP6_PARTE|nr:uncharacterized protein GSPATT00033516001 [Paramecium tetraurelia]CAK63663.1 unnamed protein product [Paramecium tetraurelia]|eukprot:XP_001431061.1 hypothetical protein (macronuclear) [Paramecium tetraurelia strain d4-2]